MSVVRTGNSLQIVSSSLISNAGYSGSPSQYYKTELQNKINLEWPYASDIYQILEESPFSSGSYVHTEVRINHTPISTTGEKLGDDWKELIFKDITHSRGIGYKYQYDNNYWLTINSDIYRKVTASTTVRRCNNSLRWIDEYGNLYTEPCVIEYKIQSNKDYGKGNFPIPEGFIQIYCQLNPNSRKIKPNQRFLFGNTDNWTAYKVYGDGVRNFLNNQTMDDDSTPLLMLTMGANYINEGADDLVNGIAEVNRIVYTISTSPSSVLGSVGDIIDFNSIIYLNDVPTDKEVTYSIISSGSGAMSGSSLTLTNSGSFIVSSCMINNTSVYKNIPVIVSASNVVNNDILVTPNPDFILQGDTINYTANLYKDGVSQSDSLSFSVNENGVNSKNYTLTITGVNSFSIKNNIKDMRNPIIIVCTSGSIIKNFPIVLKGSW